MRRSALSILSIAVTLFILAPYTVPVHAQTTSISNLTYPTTALAGGQAEVGFTVTYSTSETYALLIAVSNEANNYSTVPGDVVESSPSTCMSGAELGIVSSSLASCFDTVSGSGSEFVKFNLNLDTHTDYNDLIASAAFVDTSAHVVSGSTSAEGFSINVANTLSPNSNYVTVVTKSFGGPAIANPQEFATLVTIVIGGIILTATYRRRSRNTENRKQQDSMNVSGSANRPFRICPVHDFVMSYDLVGKRYFCPKCRPTVQD